MAELKIKEIDDTRVIVIRHCEAMGNIQRIFQGHYDGQVSDNGRVQLEKLAERMRFLPFDEIWSSPLTRARETAEAANKYYGHTVHIEERLIEINGGEWEGQKWAEFPEKFPKNAEAWNLHPQDFHPEGGESMKSVYRRMSEVVTDIVKMNSRKTVCIVSHGCAIRNLVCWAKGWPIERLREVEWCDNTGINVIDFDADFKPKLIMESDASHLDEKLSTFAHQDWWKMENIKNMRFS